MSKYNRIKNKTIRNTLKNNCYYSFEEFYNHNHDVHFRIFDNDEMYDLAKDVFDMMIEEIRTLEGIIIDNL